MTSQLSQQSKTTSSLKVNSSVQQFSSNDPKNEFYKQLAPEHSLDQISKKLYPWNLGPFMIAFIAGIIVLFILILTKPPFIYRTIKLKNTSISHKQISPWTLISVGVGTTALVYFVPFVWMYIRGKSEESKFQKQNQQ